MDERAADYAVVGLGVTGRSCARFLNAQGARVIAMDTRSAPPCVDLVREECPEVRIVTGGLDEALLVRCGCIVVSPGLSLREPAIRAALAAGVDVVGDIELFARHARAPVLAITGTNGKSTVTTLVARMLEAAGHAIRCGGNLGTPALDLLAGPAPDCYVLELSSFQLDLVQTLAVRVAAILNVTPDHLDRYTSFDDYRDAKARILAHAEAAVLNADDAVTAALPFRGQRFEFTLGPPAAGRFGLRAAPGGTMLAGPDGDCAALADLALEGMHNAANALAALAICSAFGARGPALVHALTSFPGLEHRAERVAEHGGITYINDSKATNSGAACATIKGLCQGKTGVLIAGGEAKESDFSEFADTVVAHLHTIVLIGRAAPLLAQAIGGRIATVYATDMRAAVSAAADAARSGELVLLSPACASFDMFANYSARGAAFRAAVHDLIAP